MTKRHGGRTTAPRSMRGGFSALLATAFTLAFAQAIRADGIATPVPSNIEVPAGSKRLFTGHVIGTQNYICLPSGTGVRFTLFTPQATLFDDDGNPVATHYFSPDHVDNGVARATWQHVRDTSTVLAQAAPGEASSDREFVAPGAIPWVKLTVVQAKAGRHGGDTLTKTRFIQRVNTSGGAAPAAGCASTTDVGHQAFVPYTADYVFYTDD